MTSSLKNGEASPEKIEMVPSILEECTSQEDAEEREEEGKKSSDFQEETEGGVPDEQAEEHL